MAFDMGDGSQARLPATPETVRQAMLLEQAAGRDPAAVLQRQGGAGLSAPVDPMLAGALPPAPSATGPEALAAAPGKRPSVVLDIGPPAAGPPPVKVGIGGPIDLTPAPAAPAAPLPKITADQAAKGLGVQAPAKPGAIVELSPTARPATGLPTNPFDLQAGPTDLRALQAQADAAKTKETAAAAAGPVDKSKLVATPQGGSAGAAGGEADPLANLNPEERKEYLLRQAKIRAEAAKRPSGGALVKGGKVQTGETMQAALGPDPALAAQQDWTDRLLGVYQGKLAAISERMNAAQADQQAAIEARAKAAQEAIAEAEGQELGRIQGEHRELLDRVRRAEVDPNRWWSSRSTAEKAGIGVAMFLGGVIRGLTGRADKPDTVLQEVFRQTDRDVEQQVRGIEKMRGDLNDLQRYYLQTKDRYGSEKVALEATKAVALTALQADIRRRATQAQIDAGVDVVPGPDGEPMLTGRFSLAERMAQLEAQRAIDARQANTSAALRGQIARTFGFTQDRYVGGSAGPNFDKMLADQEKQSKLLRGADQDAAKAKGKEGVASLRLPGGELGVRTGVPEALYNEMAKKLVIADQFDAGLDDMVRRAKQPGGLAPGDPALRVFSDQAATLGSQLNWAGQPNTFQEELVIEASKPGPRQDAAIEALRGQSRALRTAVAKQLGK